MNLKVLDNRRVNLHKMVDSGDSNVNVFWHLRYGHLCFHHLSLLSRFDMVDGLSDMEKMKRTCKTCLVEV
jgi:hypothetical protein